jgi:hypothetical protein
MVLADPGHDAAPALSQAGGAPEAIPRTRAQSRWYAPESGQPMPTSLSISAISPAAPAK